MKKGAIITKGVYFDIYRNTNIMKESVKMAFEYSYLAKYYDILGEHIDYKKYAEFADSINKKQGGGTSGIALDLCCGTGAISLCLDSLGYDVIGVDISPDMLSVAKEKSEERNILYLCQDMRELDLFGTVDLVVSALDSLNYLTKKSDLEKVFHLVHNFLEPGGIFVFDLNSKLKFEKVYAENSYVFEEEGIFCVWQNSYNKKSGICNFYVTIFSENEKSYYSRQDEFHKERYYSDSSVSALLKKAGFEIIGKYSDCSESSPSDGGELRTFYAARAIK